MKKVIDGKTYNTETAEFLASWWNGCSTTDFGYCSENLYRTKKGTYFIEGVGGALSKYARSCGHNSRCGGEDITPLSEFEAREWVEANANDKYEDIFGECEEA